MSFIHKTRQLSTNKQWQVGSQPISLNIHDPNFARCHWLTCSQITPRSGSIFVQCLYISIIYLKVACGYILFGPLVYSNWNIWGSNSSNKFGINYSQPKMSHLIWDFPFYHRPLQRSTQRSVFFFYSQGLIDWRSLDPGPWQRTFVDASFPQFHMFPTAWSCTTKIGLPEFYIRVRPKVTFTVT